jgi:very-short-patch-repair endonuclease
VVKFPLLFKEGPGVVMRIFNIKSQKTLRKNLRNQSPLSEKLLWNQLRNSQIGYKFRRQHGIGNYVVDFYCSKLKLVIEVDGPTHEDNTSQDEIRQKYLESLGLVVKRFYNIETQEGLGGIIQNLSEFCKQLEKNGG